ncbi:MAG: alpha/beta fold hydrolase [Thermoplasmata archaeon]
MPTVQLSNARLFAERFGDAGDPLVLIHGSWADRRSWSRLAPILSGSTRVLNYDRRGHGASSGAAPVRPVVEDAEDLAELLVAMDHYPAHLVAHGYGGSVAFRLASEHPELVRGVVVHEPPCVGLLEDDPSTTGELSALRRAILVAQGAVRAGDLDGAIRSYLLNFAEAAVRWEALPPGMRQEFRDNAASWLPESSDPEADRPSPAIFGEFLNPVLLTVGAESPRSLHRISLALGRLLKNSYAIVLRDTGHYPHLFQPAQYVGLLHRFLVERDVPAM